jgi:hypothetical protein
MNILRQMLFIEPTAMISVAHGSIPDSNGLVGVGVFLGVSLWLGRRALRSSLATPHCYHAEGNLVLS